MAKAQRYSMEQIQTAQKMLRGLAVKKSGKTKKEVVELLAEDVRKAVQQGHTLNAIQEALGKAGIQAPLSRLKALLGEKGADGSQEGSTESGQEDTPPAAIKQPVSATTTNSQEASA